MSKKSEADRLSELDQKIEQLKARKQKLQAQLGTKERKERTRRRIQIGAVFEEHFGVQGVEEAEKIAAAFRDDVQKFLAAQKHKDQDQTG